jgi:hypothetical protein
MTVLRAESAVLLQDVCPVEDAEELLHQVQDGADIVDWSACTHLHTACLQVILGAGAAMRGMPAHPELARWIAPLLAQGPARTPDAAAQGGA